MKNRALYIIAVTLLLFSQACSLNMPAQAFPTTTPPPVPTSVPPTATPPTAATATLPPTQPAPTIAPTHTSLPVVLKVDTTVVVKIVNLRRGPGTVYQKIDVLFQGAKVSVVGKARGDQWVMVNTAKGKGWLSLSFLALKDPTVVAGLIPQDIPNSFTIHGKVVDANNTPIGGIGFAVTQGIGPNTQRTDAVSMPDGNFYAYLPSASKGTWRVDFVSIDCKSPIMDANCKYTGNFNPLGVDVPMPPVGDLNFTYLKP